MYRKIMVVNRADCAVRLIRTCREMGIEAVLASARGEPARAAAEMADRVIYTGMSREAYTAQDDILEAARQTGCEAILPGWGFLSEEFGFARRARLAGIHFIGPSDRQLQIFGDKWQTLEWLLPLLDLPFSACLCSDGRIFDKIAASHGPWMVKGRFGGGGKDIRRYDDRKSLDARIALIAERREGARYFIEPAVINARHIEFQIFGDGLGSVRVLGLRDCTAQVRHQKWLEFSVDRREYPVWQAIAEKIQTAFGEMRYLGWGTVEFLMDTDGKMHLLEVNPRLQVEHGVTEMEIHCDLVREAIELSCGGRCGRHHFDQNEDGPKYDAAEFRLFAQSTGNLEKFGFDGYECPSHPFDGDDSYRFVSGYLPGDTVSGEYDGLLARFIVRAERGKALEKLRNWVRCFRCEGVENNLGDLMRYELPGTDR